MKGAPLSDTDLVEYADQHVAYEYHMLFQTASILAALPVDLSCMSISSTLNAACLTAFALHARNLIVFLYKEKKTWPNLVLVQDYIDQQTLNQSLTPITQTLKDAQGKADALAAHLIVDRLSMNRSGDIYWRFADITSDIFSAFASVAPCFPDCRVSVAFRNLIENPPDRLFPWATNIIPAIPDRPSGVAIRAL